jgi:hypothetical protein
MTGNDAKAATDTTLTMAPLDRASNGRKAWVTLYVPKRLRAMAVSHRHQPVPEPAAVVHTAAL